ncbi:uncharacterized protein LOC129592679 [Paramacrobiotus metropolitanus]|uniref:uncharacterized protein LOC129592679 n=1 Tax=Paramacrobiotus metropolitanus TaxID=2943436 RepID=UPI002446311F|nr:uncharacterized protein LOC129592679 [Paramacrobiotus metropolitanus]XP_055344745.1 uncharacterized protein LOC129592679 [Paramacrobiotus metropolitanus]
MDMRQELYETDISVLKCISISQITLSILLLGLSMFTATIDLVTQIGLGFAYLLWYILPAEFILGFLTLFLGSYGVYMIRNEVRIKRQFDILSVTSIINCILCVFILVFDGFTVAFRLIAFMHGVYLYGMARTSSFLDILVQSLAIVILVLSAKTAQITLFHAGMLAGGPQVATENVRYRNEKASGAEKPLLEVP